jgi:hypothetical protein
MPEHGSPMNIFSFHLEQRRGEQLKRSKYGKPPSYIALMELSQIEDGGALKGVEW